MPGYEANIFARTEISVTNAFIVMGYNNIRLGDVKKIESYAREFHDAELILCKDGISDGP